MDSRYYAHNGFDEINRILGPKAAMLSEIHCRGSYVDKVSCRWYHESWLFLKQIQMVSRPLWQERFFTDSVQNAVSHLQSPRILICGAADFEMFAVTARALQSCESVYPKYIMLDLCSTPLVLTKMYAELQGGEVSLIKGDALQLPFSKENFDLIVTDVFLTRFSRKDKNAVISEWRRVLKTGGVVLTTARIEPSFIQEQELVAKPLQQFRYVIRALVRAIERRMSPLPFIKHAYNYSRRITSIPFVSREEITNLFQPFKIQLSTNSTPGEMKPTLYVCIYVEKH